MLLKYFNCSSVVPLPPTLTGSALFEYSPQCGHGSAWIFSGKHCWIKNLLQLTNSLCSPTALWDCFIGLLLLFIPLSVTAVIRYTGLSSVAECVVVSDIIQ